MGSFDRKVRRNGDSELVTEDQQRFPVGRVVSSPVKGECMGLPMLGWISLRKGSEIRLLMLALLLLREGKPIGLLNVEIPIYPETERNTLWMLQSFGWDGRVWPKDEGWPTGSADEPGLQHMLGQAGLVSSIVFPPSKTGDHATMDVNISRAKGNFFMPPLPDAEVDPDPKLVSRFHELCLDYKVFYPVQATSTEKRDHGEVLH